MRHTIIAGLFASTLPLAAAFAQADPIMVEQPWARATAGQGRTAAVYLTLMDHGDADALIGVSTPAGMAMLHETILDKGVARMRMLDSVPLPPHVPVTFRPGAMHIMLTGLKAPLKAGTSLPVTLQFAHAAPITVSVPVLAPGASGPAGAAGDMSGMKMD